MTRPTLVARYTACTQRRKNKHTVYFRIRVNKNGYDAQLAYSQILALLEADKENPTLWKSSCLVSYPGRWTQHRMSSKGSACNLPMGWATGYLIPPTLCETGELENEEPFARTQLLFPAVIMTYDWHPNNRTVWTICWCIIRASIQSLTYLSSGKVIQPHCHH